MEIEEIEITELPRAREDRRKKKAIYEGHRIMERRKKQRRKKVSNQSR